MPKIEIDNIEIEVYKWKVNPPINKNEPFDSVEFEGECLSKNNQNMMKFLIPEERHNYEFYGKTIPVTLEMHIDEVIGENGERITKFFGIIYPIKSNKDIDMGYV